MSICSRLHRSITVTTDAYCALASPRIATVSLGSRAFWACSWVSSSLADTGAPFRRRLPSGMTITIANVVRSVLGLLLGLGRLIDRPCTVAVVIRMKTTSSTYARSSIGVTLIES